MQTVLVDQLIDEIVGSYRVVRLLGHTRLNALYLVHHLSLQRTDALMLYLVPERFSPDVRHRFLSRFLQDAAAIKALEHRHILPVYDYGEYAGHPYLVTPSALKGSLADVLKQKGHIGCTDVMAILRQVGAGLGHAHRNGYVHGALTPSTLLLGSENTIQIASFGLVQMLQLGGLEEQQLPYAHLLSIAHTYVAVPAYIAPEVLEGQVADRRSDIYALGVVLFELLSGHVPFAGTTFQEIAQQQRTSSASLLHTLSSAIPMPLASVVMRALEPDPEQRFQQVSELVEAFAHVAEFEKEGMKRPGVDVIPELVNEGRKTPRTDDLVAPPGRQSPMSESQGLSPVHTSALGVQAPWQLDHGGNSIQPSFDTYPMKQTGTMSRRKLIAVLATVGVTVGGGMIIHALTTTPQASDKRSVAAHAGAIGTTAMAVNSADAFTNRADGRASLLIRLPGNNFVAYEKNCTHAGVFVTYDEATHMLVCPAHNAIFDPSQGGKVVQGPAPSPLPTVHIHINADGSITLA